MVGPEEPPQPATSATLRRAAAVSRRARDGVSLLVGKVCGIWSRWGLVLCGIWFRLGLLRGFAFSPRSVLRGRLLRRCFALRDRQRFCLTARAKQR